MKRGARLLLLGAILPTFPLAAQEVHDSTKTVQLQDIVVTASRLHEDIRKPPVTIEKVSLSAIQQSAAPSFFDALENVKGVQMITTTRTFNRKISGRWNLAIVVPG